MSDRLRLDEERAQSLGKAAGFVVRQQEPFNGGPPPEALYRQPITPTELFYVRNHAAIPQVDPVGYRLQVEGLVERPLDLSLDDLRTAFERRTLTAALQCAGNRRSGLMQVRPIPRELGWGDEAVSNGIWTGAPLGEVLRAAGVSSGDLHVDLLGLDQVERQGATFGYGGSLPLEKALADEVLLAYELNGAPLQPVHGFPLRLVAPGYIGARSVKWLARIRVQERPSENYFQRRAYRLFPPQVNAENVDWDSGLMLGDFPVNAVICSPAQGAALPAGDIEVGGYALAGGGRRIARVDLSIDGGRSWLTVDYQQESAWSWALWSARIRLSSGSYQLAVRAWDSAANTQPEDPAGLWNFKGYLNNAWHRLQIEVT